MIVYRVERDDKGPYSHREAGIHDVLSKMHADDNHPSIWAEPFADKVSSAHHCGFNSLDQFFDWMCDKSIALLSKAGFNLVAFEVDPDNVLFGTHQVMFIKSEAKVVESIPI